MQNFVPAIISYMHYSRIEHWNLSTLYHFRYKWQNLVLAKKKDVLGRKMYL